MIEFENAGRTNFADRLQTGGINSEEKKTKLPISYKKTIGLNAGRTRTRTRTLGPLTKRFRKIAGSGGLRSKLSVNKRLMPLLVARCLRTDRDHLRKSRAGCIGGARVHFRVVHLRCNGKKSLAAVRGRPSMHEARFPIFRSSTKCKKRFQMKKIGIRPRKIKIQWARNQENCHLNIHRHMRVRVKPC